jgi:hypothetical protein
VGHIAHHAIIVTGSNREHVRQLRLCAIELGACVSEISPIATNHFYSFAVFPDGSKEGWPASDEGDERRRNIVKAATEAGVDFVEVCFGGDLSVGEARIVNSGE